MFIESLTPDQLVQFAQALMLAAAIGGFLGASAGPLFELFVSFLGWGIRTLFSPKKSELAVIKDLQVQRRVFLIRARTAGRELRKHQLRQTLGRHAE